jgi:ferredoxin
VNHSACDGNGLCVEEAPDLLSLDEDDMLHILLETLGEEALERARRAVNVCPKAALTLVP